MACGGRWLSMRTISGGPKSNKSATGSSGCESPGGATLCHSAEVPFLSGFGHTSKRYRAVHTRSSEGNVIKPPTEQFEAFAEQLHGLKKGVEDALAEAGIRGLDLLAYALERADDLPAKGGSEGEAEEHHLRIACCGLLEDVPPERAEQSSTRDIGDVYETELMGPLRTFLDVVERTTASHSYEEVFALVEHAGARVFKGLESGRSFDRRVGVTLYLLLSHTRGHRRP
jgi:hypothetical protein